MEEVCDGKKRLGINAYHKKVLRNLVFFFAIFLFIFPFFSSSLSLYTNPSPSSSFFLIPSIFQSRPFVLSNLFLRYSLLGSLYEYSII